MTLESYLKQVEERCEMPEINEKEVRRVCKDTKTVVAMLRRAVEALEMFRYENKGFYRRDYYPAEEALSDLEAMTEEAE